MTNDEENVMKISRGLPRRGGMWRIIYSVSPRTPEGGQAEKGDKPPLLHILRSRGVIPSSRWLPSKEECGDGKGKK